jgi:hypothetical protein
MSSAHTVGDISNPGSPGYANAILNGFVTPTVAPGHTVNFLFNVTNPYGEETAVMWNLTLSVGVYKYSTQETTRVVNEDFKHAPSIDGLGAEVVTQLEPIAPGDTTRLELHITTTRDTPHGSYFSQSTYFVRFRLSFNFSGNSTQVVLQSRGYFTDDQWDQLVSFSADESIVNTTYMRSLGIDGLLPDSAFGLRVPIPRWPLGVLIAAICGLSVMALYYFVLDNPGKYPRLEKRFYYLRGKLRELRSQLKDRSRK